MPLRYIPDLVYGEVDGKPLLLDMVAPLDDGPVPRPAIIWVHGFGWFAGTRRDNLEVSMGTSFAAHGFIAVSIEYRLSDEASFPAQLHDVKGAIRWLWANAATYGVDPARIGISGGSAGGMLAALAGLTREQHGLEGWSVSQPVSSRVQAVAVASAPSDLHRPGGAMRNDVDGPVSWLFGGTVVEKADLMRLASPIAHVHADAPPFLIAHGTLDETVPFAQGQALARALEVAGAEVEFHPIDGVYHNWMTEIEGPPGREETWKLGPLALPFFRTHLQR